MPVLGIDFGTSCVIITAARRGGVEVVVNDLTKRSTPAVVSFGSVERYIGEGGANQLTFNAENSVPFIKRLIGLKFSQIERELSSFPCKITQGEGDTILVHVKYLDKMTTFSPVQLLGMLFGKCKYLAEKDLGDLSPTSAVIGVPGYFTDEQRRAVMQACEIAQISVIRLLNESTAASIVHGIYTEDVKDGQNVAFVDVGHSITSVSIIKFNKEEKKDKVHVLGAAFERNVGAGSLERLLFDYYVAEIQKKYKLDVLSNSKATLRLSAACEKLKKVLSANTSGQMRVECLMNDVDVSFTMDRAQFEDMCKPYLEQLHFPVKQALENANLTMKDISYVQLIGGGSYIPVIRTVIQKVFEGVHMGTTINATESISRGCGLAAAMGSNKFSLAKQFEFVESIQYPVDLGWKSDVEASTGETDEINKTSAVFKLGEGLPNTKLLKFQKREDFYIYALYAENPHLPEGTNKRIAKVLISGMSKDKKIDEVRVKIGLNKNGCVFVESAQQSEEIEVEEEVKKEGSDEKEKKIVRKQVRTDLQFNVIPHQYSAKEIAALKDAERVMREQDELIFTTSEAKNSIESYIYDYQQKLSSSGELYPYISGTDREAFLAKLSEREDWLGCDGEKETREVYRKVLEELRAIGNPILKRKDEDQKRPAAIKMLKGFLDDYVTFANFVDDSNNHITHEERETMRGKVTEIESWLNDFVTKQSKLQKYDDAVLTTEMIKDKSHALMNVCNPIKNKPKPKVEEPKKEEEKKEDKMDEEKK